MEGGHPTRLRNWLTVAAAVVGVWSTQAAVGLSQQAALFVATVQHVEQARSASLEPAAHPRATWFRTANFSVLSQDGRFATADLAERCEQIRESLQLQWLPARAQTALTWNPPCEVVVHESETAYLRQVGWQAAMTRGVCRVDIQQGRIVRRRIDLMVDPATRELTALAHELTHVVLADHFLGRQAPRWADEGMALLADHPQKQVLHRNSVRRALDQQACPSIRETMSCRDYPRGSQLGVFYGHSLSLVEFLVELDTPARLVEFVDAALQHGYDRAAREVYGLAGVAELQQRWRAHFENSDTMRLASRATACGSGILPRESDQAAGSRFYK